jgi:hypothetical protein
MAELNVVTNSLKQVYFKDEEINIFNLLIDYTNDMIKYRQLIFYVGTSCDNKQLRIKLNKINSKLFKNVMINSNTLKSYFETGLVDENNNKKIRRLFCFTLSALNFLKSLTEKLIYLLNQFHQG